MRSITLRFLFPILLIPSQFLRVNELAEKDPSAVKDVGQVFVEKVRPPFLRLFAL